MNHLLADRAEQQAGKSPSATIADDDQGRVSRLLQEHLGWVPFERRALTLNRGVQPFGFCDCFADDRLRVLEEAVEYRLVAWREAGREDGLRHLPDGNDAQARSSQFRLPGRHPERRPGAL